MPAEQLSAVAFTIIAQLQFMYSNSLFTAVQNQLLINCVQVLHSFFLFPFLFRVQILKTISLSILLSNTKPPVLQCPGIKRYLHFSNYVLYLPSCVTVGDKPKLPDSPGYLHMLGPVYFFERQPVRQGAPAPGSRTRSNAPR